MEWQQIETAPRDGTNFLAALNFGGMWEYAVMLWDEYEEDWVDGNGMIIGVPWLWSEIVEPQA